MPMQQQQQQHHQTVISDISIIISDISYVDKQTRGYSEPEDAALQ
jgi:hypothetical protein